MHGVRRPSRAPWALLAAAWAILVWWLLTFEPRGDAPLAVDWLPSMLLPWADKLAHAGLFLVQAVLVQRAAIARLGPWRALLLALAISVALGAATELRQRSVPGRDADAADFAANLLGALAAAATLPLSRRRRAPA